jgi:hypothetical protein
MTSLERVAGRVDETIKSLQSLGERDLFETALQLLSLAEEQRGLSPTELAYKARAIQLLDDEASPHTLESVPPILQRAIELDWQNVSPLTDLAYFHFAVEDDPKTALPHFREAVRLARWLLTEAANGLASCLEELEGKRAARRELLQIHRQALLAEKLDRDFLPWVGLSGK